MEPVEPVQMNIYQSNTYRKWIPIHESLFYHIVQSNVKPCNGLFSHISSPLATIAYHFLHYLLVDQLYANEVYFCSFVTKFNKAFTRYSPDVFNSFYWTAAHGESHRIFTSPPQTIHKISVGPNKVPHTLFFCFKQNSLFGGSPLSMPWSKSRRNMNPVVSN